MSGLSDGQKLALFDTLGQQRNDAWLRVSELESRLAAVEGHLAKYEEAIEDTIDNGLYFTEDDGCRCHPSYLFVDSGEFLAVVRSKLNGG